MKKYIKALLSEIHFVGFVGMIKRRVISIRRRMASTDQKLINAHLSDAQLKKLHISCGINILPGWLNSEYFPESNRLLHLDATKTYPFTDNEFDYIFSEHMIEHVHYLDGMRLLSECFRVLKTKGKLRLSTPDLAFLIDLYKADKSQLQIEFIKDSTNRHIKYAPYCEDTFVINNYVRDWGHQFIYDEKTLRYSLEKVGFVDVIRFRVSESNDKALQNLEHVSRKSPGLIALESCVLEATKP